MGARPADPVHAPEHFARGARFFLDRDMEAGEVYTLRRGSAAVFTARCPGKAGPNEDGAALLPFAGAGGAAEVFVVADGVGGRPAGEQASSLAIHAFEAALKEAASRDKDCRTAILDGFEHANQAVLELGGGAATTLAVAAVEAGSLRTFHVGDSLILVLGQRGRLKLQTVSHSPVGYAVEAGLLDEKEAMHHEDRHLVSNIVGSGDMRIEVGSPLPLAPHDTVLLATDGLLDNLHLSEIVERTRCGPLFRVAEELSSTSRRRMDEPRVGHPSKPDDVTFILYRRRTRDRVRDHT